MSTVIPQSPTIIDADVPRTLTVNEPDGDGDFLLMINEGELEAGLYLDAHGAAVLRNALDQSVELVAPAMPAENEGLIAAAIVYERTIEFAYDKGSGVIEQRRVIPRVTYDAPNGIVVTGDDQDRDDVRAFRLDRIQGSVKLV